MRRLRGNPLFMGGHGERRRELAQKSPRHSALRPIARSHAPRRLDNRSDSTRHGRPGERCKLLHGKLRIATLPLVVEGQKAGAEERDEHVEVRPQVLRQPQRVALCSMSTRRIPSAPRTAWAPSGAAATRPAVFSSALSCRSPARRSSASAREAPCSPASPLPASLPAPAAPPAALAAPRLPAACQPAHPPRRTSRVPGRADTRNARNVSVKGILRAGHKPAFICSFISGPVVQRVHRLRPRVGRRQEVAPRFPEEHPLLPPRPERHHPGPRLRWPVPRARGPHQPRRVTSSSRGGRIGAADGFEASVPARVHEHRDVDVDAFGGSGPQYAISNGENCTPLSTGPPSAR